jgi:hypothetical protein
MNAECKVMNKRKAFRFSIHHLSLIALHFLFPLLPQATFDRSPRKKINGSSKGAAA